MTAVSERVFHIDCHAHLHPSFDIVVWLSHALQNLLSTDVDTGRVVPVVIVVDREGVSTSEMLNAAHRDGTVSVESVLSDGSLLVALRSGPLVGKSLLVVPGIQVVSKEGIEVLGLGVATRPEERIASSEQVHHIISEGGLPCIPWSPGKWLGRRGRVVHALFDIFGPHQITVGDIPIRSAWGPPSPLLAHARSSGFPVLYGSDPLPFPGEERMVGSFGVALKGEPVSATGIVSWILERLRDPSKIDGITGNRNPPLAAFSRFLRSNIRRR
jgi:hypothetical protein